MTCEDGTTELRILVVEDEALIAMELQMMLEDLGHRVVAICGTVERALARLDEHGDGLDAVLLDAKFGGRSSRRVADALRDRRIPFLVTSGYGAVEIEQLGPYPGHLAKPYDERHLRRALDELDRAS